MAVTKRVVILANSYKGGEDRRCVAGRELHTDRIGGWIRPDVDATGAVPFSDRSYADGSEPALGDVVLISVRRPMGRQDHQRENWELDSGVRWRQITTVGWRELVQLDEAVVELWDDRMAGDSNYGLNNRVRSVQASQLDSSLRLIRVCDLRISVVDSEGRRKRRVDGEFRFAQVDYRLSITDPVLQDRFSGHAAGDYDLGECLLTVSLGEPYKDGFCYKLIAGIIERKRYQQ